MNRCGQAFGLCLAVLSVGCAKKVVERSDTAPTSTVPDALLPHPSTESFFTRHTCFDAYCGIHLSCQTWNRSTIRTAASRIAMGGWVTCIRNTR